MKTPHPNIQPDALRKRLGGTQRMVLRTLNEAGEPLFNGTLSVRTGLRWNSEVFASLRRLGLIEGHPITLTAAGRAVLVAASGPRT